jgi:hypothetical protein
VAPPGQTAIMISPTAYSASICVIRAMAKAIIGRSSSWLRSPIMTLNGLTAIFLISSKEMDNPSPSVMMARVMGRKISEKIVGDMIY